MATDAIERARARKAAEDTVRKLDLIMKHLGIVDPLAPVADAPVVEAGSQATEPANEPPTDPGQPDQAGNEQPAEAVTSDPARRASNKK